MKPTSHGVSVIASPHTHRYLVIAAVALAAVVAFLTFELFTAPRIEAVSPGPETFLKDSNVQISVDLPGADKLSDLSLRLDGRDVTPNVHVSDGRLYLDADRLSDGQHVVALRAHTSNLLRPTVHKTWRFVVDTVAPRVVITRPQRDAAVTALPVTLTGTTEAGATVTVSVDLDESERVGAAAIAADHDIVDRLTVSPTPRVTAAPSIDPPSSAPMAGGEGTVVGPPPPEPADDVAGDPSPAGSDAGSPSASTAADSGSPGPTPTTSASPTTEVRVIADASGRFTVALTLPDGPTAVRITATDEAGNAFTEPGRFVVDVDPPDLIVGGLGKVVRDSKPRITIIATDQAGTPRVRVRLDGEVVYEKPLAGQFSLPSKVLAEGSHTLLVTATDPGHNVTTDDREFLVNSTEKLGKATLIAGAKGHDVRDLQKLLANQDYFKGKKTGVYDKATIKAVEHMQTSLGMTPDGIAGPLVLGALRGRIVIDQSEHRLYFYVGGTLKRTYSVATGQPAWPTPNGTFYVQWMTKNPTWTPPDSPWAAGAKPIPPGPNNPVGMRWIGTSYPGVGIHGVPPSEDDSIGTYASHGCIRMHEWDVEQLYAWVTTGMPVIIRP